MGGFDSLVFNLIGDDGLRIFDQFKMEFLDATRKGFCKEKIHVGRIAEKYPVWYSLVTDEHSSAELLEYYFEHSDFVDEKPLTPEECDYLLREIFSDYKISDEKLHILVNHGVVSSGLKKVYTDPNPDYKDIEDSWHINCDCSDRNAPNAMYYAIFWKYPVSTLKILHEEAKVPYDVDCMGVPFIVHAMENDCSDEVFRYLADIAPWDFDGFSFEDSEDGIFGVDLTKPNYLSVDFKGIQDGFGHDINYYIEKYDRYVIWKKVVDEWASAAAEVENEAYAEGR